MLVIILLRTHLKIQIKALVRTSFDPDVADILLAQETGIIVNFSFKPNSDFTKRI